MRKLALNDSWRLHEAPLAWNADSLAMVSAFDGDWMDCDVPVDIHMPLEAVGKIGDVIKADNSLRCAWTQRRSWWFLRAFNSDDIDMRADAIELTFESLDAHADVFINGKWLGCHDSAFYPFSRGIKEYLRNGENQIALRLTSGLERVSESDLAELNWSCSHEDRNGRPERGDLRRMFVRKPQYCVGWDWAPRAVTCGIMKDVYITSYRKTAIRGIRIHTESAKREKAVLHIELSVEQLHPYASRDADIQIEIVKDGEVCARILKPDALLVSGLNTIDAQAIINDPKLWWPSGYGDQPMYEARVSVICEGENDIAQPTSFGIRTVSLDNSRAKMGARNFRLIINGAPIFCKGANWVPADSIYARVTKDRYDALVGEAREASFNMLRVWGGGLYEPDAFYEACDREGILVWQDFMFACAAYPDHREEFRVIVDHELRYQTKRLRNHPCLVLWCGNNENQMTFNPVENPAWALPMSHERQFGLYLTNNMAAEAVRDNCREIPYWPSSPYGGVLPNDESVGDVHYWDAWAPSRDPNERVDPFIYDTFSARFVSEYGFPGPCRIESVRQYTDQEKPDMSGRVWKMHVNTCENRTVRAGVMKHYGLDIDDLDIEGYILYAGMVQANMLGYSLEAIRYRADCAGALFWMFNDAWGEVGWSILDHYMRRKSAFYSVKRALAPIKLTLRKKGDTVYMQGINDTDQPVYTKARVGYQRYCDGSTELPRVDVALAPRSRERVGSWNMPLEDYTRGTFMAIPDNPAIDPCSLRVADWKDCRLATPTITVRETVQNGSDILYTLKAPFFTHCVYLDTPLNCSDNYFDLYPNVEKQVIVEKARNADMRAWKALGQQ